MSDFETVSHIEGCGDLGCNIMSQPLRMFDNDDGCVFRQFDFNVLRSVGKCVKILPPLGLYNAADVSVPEQGG